MSGAATDPLEQPTASDVAEDPLDACASPADVLALVDAADAREQPIPPEDALERIREIEDEGARSVLDYTLTPEDLAALEGMDELREMLDHSVEMAREAPEVDSEESAQRATEILGILAKARKAAEAKRLEIKGPFTASGKVADSTFRELVDPVRSAEQALKDQVGGFVKRRREESERERARLQAEADERQRQAEADAAAAAAPPPEPPPPVEVPEPERTTRSVSGTTSATTRERWAFRVVAPEHVPREYLTVNEKALGAAVRAGQREIPGIEIYRDDVVGVRS